MRYFKLAKFSLSVYLRRIGENEKTFNIVKDITEKVFSSNGGGFPDDEDNGTVSCWYIHAKDLKEINIILHATDWDFPFGCFYLKAYNTRSRKLACKGLELSRVSIFCKKDYIFRPPSFTVSPSKPR